MAKKTNEIDDLGFGDWFQDEPAEDPGVAEAKAREEAERKAREEAERQAREAAERKAREEAERQAREAAERKAREAAERAAREEAERVAREAAERAAREAAERAAREAAERAAREAAERAAREAAERAAREAAERAAREAAELAARQEAERAERAAREAAELAAREEAERLAQEQASLEDSWFSGADSSQGVASVTASAPSSGPTIVAPEEEPSAPVQVAEILPAEPPSVEIAPPTTIEVEVEPASQEVAVADVSVVEEEEEDLEATADSFIDGTPDQTMVMRRQNAEIEAEIAAARAEREGRRSRVQDVIIPSSAEPSAPPPPVVPPPIPVPAPLIPFAVQSAPLEAQTSTPEVAGAWSEDAALLEREAAVAVDVAHQGALLAEAGRIHASRLGNMDVAERLLGLAIQGGTRDAELLKLYGATVAAREDLVLLRHVLERRANASQGVVAAEALQDAALLERNMRQDANAVALLERALELAPDDWFTLRLLRELHYRARNWDGLCMVLTSMAGLATGPRAARYLVEQGRIFEEQLSRADQARASYDLALEAEPTYAPALLAVERLAHTAGDLARLADLYETQARLAEGADAAFWWARSARFAMRAGLDDARIAAAYEAALATSAPDAYELRHEHQHFLATRGHVDALVASLEAEASQLSGPEAAPVFIRLGAVLAERAPDAAIGAWRAALEADPTADPALESLIRALSAAGRNEELLAVFDEHSGRVDDQNFAVTLLYRAGELCEGPLGDLPAASARYRRILETSAGYLPALEGLERVAERMSDWQTLVALAEQRALLSEESSVISLHNFRAGMVCELRLGDRERARAFYKRSLETQGRYVAALDAYTRLLENEGSWEALADTLSSAALASEDGNEVVSFTYRAGRIYAEKVGNTELAMTALRRCLELSPGFLPAMALLRDLCVASGHWHEAYDLYRQEAEAVENPSRRHWRMLGAAGVARHLPDLDPATIAQEILNEDPNNLAAMSLLEQRALETGDTAGLVAVYRRRAAASQDPSVQARLISRVADLSRDAGDAVAAVQAITEVIEIDTVGRPLFALARVAEGVHYWDEAQRALRTGDEAGHLVELARLQETYVSDAAAAAAAWRRVLEQDPNNTEAAAGVERTVTRTGGREGLAEAHAILADHLPDPAIRTVHALLAGHLFEAAGDRDQAARYFRIAFEARPAQGKAFDALRRLYIGSGDADGLESLFGALSEPAPLDLALALEDAGATSKAASIYQAWIGTLLADEPLMLPLQVRLAAVLSATDQWQQVFEILGQELASLRDPENRRHVESRRRRVLAEKLAETEQAWEFYRQLHEEQPADREVLEALARIAHARGEADLALSYLEGLTRVTSNRDEAARYQRRVADIYRTRGDDDGARQAYLRALDFQPEDLEALAGLKSLAQNQGNWQALVGVLAREATMLSGAERVDRYREIARIWEENIKERAVAVDAWRKVLEAVPGDLEALQHMVNLTRALEDHAAFVDVARLLVAHLDGPERALLRTEIGRICLEHLYNEPEALTQLEGAAADGSLEASQLLERIFAGRGDWERSVAAILRQAELAPDEAVGLMLRAAQVRLEMLHDQEGVDAIYQRVLEVDPDNGEALRFRGAHLFKREDLAGAVEVWRRLEVSELGRDLDDFDVRMEVSLYFFRFAEAERQLGQLEDALTHYRRALELNPSHLPSLEAVGPVYVQLGKWEQAGDTYRSILQLTGGQGDMDRIAATYVSLGIVDQNLGDLEKAKKRFSKALEIRPNHVGALLGTASVLFARGEWNNLLNIYNNIIYHAQEPSRVIEAYLAKGYVLDAKMNLPDKGAQHYQKSLDYDPAQPTALLRLAEIALRKREYPVAGAFADRGLGLTLSDGKLRAALLLVRAAALAAADQSESANASFQAALEADASWMGLGERLPGADAIARALKERLQAAL